MRLVLDGISHLRDGLPLLILPYFLLLQFYLALHLTLYAWPPGGELTLRGVWLSELDGLLERPEFACGSLVLLAIVGIAACLPEPLGRSNRHDS